VTIISLDFEQVIASLNKRRKNEKVRIASDLVEIRAENHLTNGSLPTWASCFQSAFHQFPHVPPILICLLTKRQTKMFQQNFASNISTNSLMQMQIWINRGKQQNYYIMRTISWILWTDENVSDIIDDNTYTHSNTANTNVRNFIPNSWRPFQRKQG
jgi:hypothetical protein